MGGDDDLDVVPLAEWTWCHCSVLWLGGRVVGGNFWVYVARALFSYKWVQCLNINLH